MNAVQYDPLFNPKREPPPALMRLIDTSSWLLPAVAAILATLAGVAGLLHDDHSAAWLGVVGGVVGAIGVFAAVYAARIRDNRLAVANSLGSLGLDIADQAMRRVPGLW